MPDFGRWGANGGDPSLNAIARTDRYLDALASEQPVYATDPADAELAGLMSGWRDEVRRPPTTGRTAAATPRSCCSARSPRGDVRGCRWPSRVRSPPRCCASAGSAPSSTARAGRCAVRAAHLAVRRAAGDPRRPGLAGRPDGDATGPATDRAGQLGRRAGQAADRHARPCRPSRTRSGSRNCTSS